jgi:hypothetical protein
VHDDGTGPALYVGGEFSTAGGIPVNKIARWNGSTWSAVGTGLNQVHDLTSFDDGSGAALYAAGSSLGPTHVGVMKWDGATWTPLGAPAGAGTYAVEGFDDGSGPALYMAGYFTSVGGTLNVRRIARWDGQNWQPLGNGLSWTVEGLAIHDDGNGPALYVCGDFLTAGNTTSHAIAAWRRCAEPIDTVCFGDGTITACPCPPNGTLGNGCPNSVHPGGARLDASGSPAADSVVLQASTVLPNTPCLFFQGDVLQHLPWSLAHGDGLRCAIGQQRRLYSKFASGGLASAPEAGDASVSQRALAQGDVLTPGSVRYYQVYYRDPSPTFCVAGATWNLTNGVRVVW